MNKKQLYISAFSLVFVLFSNFGFSQSIQTTADLMNALSYADEAKSIKMVDDFAVAHPQMVKEILLLQNPQAGPQEFAKRNAFNCLKCSSYRELISQAEFFDVALTLISNIDLYHRPQYRSDALAWYRGGLAYYGFNRQIKTYEHLISLFNNVFGLLTSLEKSGLIINSGLMNSLLVKLQNARDAIEKHREKGINQAINKIEAAINEASAQEGKHFKADGCIVFLKYCSNLIAQIKVTNF